MSDPWIVFHPFIPFAWLLPLFIGLLLFFLWKEYHREMRFRPLRMIAISFTMIAVLGMALQPARKATVNSSFLLLTDGYEKQQADSLLDAHPGLQIVLAPGADNYSNAGRISSWNDLENSGRPLHFLLGSGIPEFAWRFLDGHHPRYIPSNFPEGFVALSIPKNIRPNRVVNIEGTYNLQGEHATLRLSLGHALEDSVVLEGGGMKKFSFTIKPKQAGNFVYDLSAERDSKITTEQVPVTVESEHPLNILLLNHQPTFETQYLKQYLGDRGHRIALRYQPSKNIFRHESINQSLVRFERLTPTLLNTFDLVIADQSVLTSLSSAEVTSLKRSVMNGLGLLVNVNEPIKKGSNQNALIPFETLASKADTVDLHLSNQQRLLLAASPVAIKKSDNIQILHQDKNRIIAGYQSKGLGSVGIQILEKTYPLILRGDTIAYGNIWTPLIERIGRRNLASHEIELNSSFPLIQNWPIDVNVISTDAEPKLHSDSIELPLAEDISIDDVWHTTAWAGQKGWHTLKTSDGLEEPYYVFEPEQWESLRTANQIRLATINSRPESLNLSQGIEYRKISPLIFFLVLLISLGVVWFVPKA